MLDLIVRRARRPGKDGLVDVGMRDGRITAVEPRLKLGAVTELDAGGRLLAPPFVDSHFHLDAVLTAGTPRRNASGTLLEGIALWAELQPLLSFEGVKERARCRGQPEGRLQPAAEHDHAGERTPIPSAAA